MLIGVSLRLRLTARKFPDTLYLEMAKKTENKQEVKFEKFLPGENKWLGRRNKTREDLKPAGNRERVANAQRVVSFSMEHKPRRSVDWQKFRGH